MLILVTMKMLMVVMLLVIEVLLWLVVMSVVMVGDELGGGSVGRGRGLVKVVAGLGVGGWGLGVLARPVIVEKAVMLAQILQEFPGSDMETLILEIS